MASEFDFIQFYKELDPSASREVIDARFRGFQKLTPSVDTMAKVYDLCRLAFQLENDSVISWFEDPIKKVDPHFSTKSDKVDAGRMASLLLRHQITRPKSYVPLAVLATSYCGRRQSVDNDLVTKLASEALIAEVHTQQIGKGASLSPAPKLKPNKIDIDALNAPSALPGTTVKAAIDSIIASTDIAISALTESVKVPISQDRKDIVRLAEEVDMLWWYVGEWLELIDKPRSELSSGLRMVVSGIELGTMVRQLPGPFGAVGILRKIAATETKDVNIGEIIAAISQEDAAKLARPMSQESMALVPVHAAFKLLAEQGANWEQAFENFIPGILKIAVSPYEIGIQAFRERALLGHGGVS